MVPTNLKDTPAKRPNPNVSRGWRTWSDISEAYSNSGDEVQPYHRRDAPMLRFSPGSLLAWLGNIQVAHFSGFKRMLMASMMLLFHVISGLWCFKHQQKTMERSTMLLMGKLTISMAIFNSYVSHYQRVCFFVTVPRHSKLGSMRFGSYWDDGPQSRSLHCHSTRVWPVVAEHALKLLSKGDLCLSFEMTMVHVFGHMTYDPWWLLIICRIGGLDVFQDALYLLVRKKKWCYACRFNPAM